MILVLFFLIILFFIAGIFFSKIKINIKQINFQMFRNEMYQKEYCINFGIYLYGKIKILSITFEDNDIKIMGKKINTMNFTRSDIYRQIEKIEFGEIDKKELIKIFKNVKFEKFNLNLDLGTDSTLITSFLIFAASTIISLIVKKGVVKYNPKKHSFIITPRYENCNLIKIDLKSIISFKTANVFKMLMYINKISKKQKRIDENRVVNKKKHYPGYV